MRRKISLILLVALCFTLCASQTFAVDFKKGSSVTSPRPGHDLAVSVELVGEREAVYGQVESIGISFNTTRDAYVVIYNVDAEGYVHLLFPADGRPVRVEGRKTHFLPEPGSGAYWETGGETGIEYIHALAVEEADRLDEDELYFLSTSERLSDEKRLRVDLDPFLAFNMIDEEIVRDADDRPPATDYTYFYINRRVDYPRYICAKCHGADKVVDPYARECPEVVIERISYADDPRYPYPPLYDIGYAEEESQHEDYSSAEEYDELEGEEVNDDDTRIYLSFGYGYPWYSSGPYYGCSFIGWGFYPVWDPFWGCFSWNMWWGDYYWWPYWYGRSWYYPAYWGWHDPYWHWGDDWHWRHSGAYRRVYGDRSVVKRSLDYGTTHARLTRERALEDSRLMQAKRRSVADRLDRSDLRRRTADRALDSRASDLRERDARSDRAVVRTPRSGKTERGREAVRGAQRSTGTRSTDRSRQAIDRRTTRTIRGDDGRTTQRSRDADRERSTVRPNTPERRSRNSERSISPPPRARDSGERESRRSGESVRNRRVSTDSAAHRPSRASVGSPPRSSAPPARSAPRSSSTPYRGASGSTRGGAGKTRSR